MKYKLLSVSKYPNVAGVNIGDYVQALASSQFLPRVDGFIDRDEELQDYSGDQCKVIMNGWYMHLPYNWPPSKLIDPLFVAFHINSKVKENLLSSVSIDYLKKHEPIGCRDYNTMKMLKNCGVEAYFSGCMTLTLGKKYHSNEREDKIYIVDPIFNGKLDVNNVIKAIATILRYPSNILKLYKNKQLRLHNGRNFLAKALKTALYFKEYSRVFSEKIIMEATYVCQESMAYKTDFRDDSERLVEAERIVRQYSKAALVITSRIHCALPCLGLETPVVYLERAHDVEESTCRLAGLLELFNVVKIDNGSLIPQFRTALPITNLNPPVNKDSWKELANALIHRCEAFVKSVNDTK